MQSHELFGQIADHFIGNVGQIKNFTRRNVFADVSVLGRGVISSAFPV